MRQSVTPRRKGSKTTSAVHTFGNVNTGRTPMIFFFYKWIAR